jgi:tRNA (cmo5U34)-methyltransferase
MRSPAIAAPEQDQEDVAQTFETGAWEFTPEVVGVFDSHVRAHAPHYDVIQTLVAEVADWTLPEGGTYADIGASTGETLRTLLGRRSSRRFKAYLYDESGPMLDRAKALLNTPAVASDRGPVMYHQATLPEDGLQHEAADLTVSVFTLQFMGPAARAGTLALARQHAPDTGCLLVAEKVRPPDSRWAEIANARSHDWKAEHGVSAEAIRAKERSLRGVLRPGTVGSLRQEILDAGWASPEVLFAWHNWVVLGAFAR